MLIFEKKTRIDLINRKYSYLPLSKHSWEELPKNKDEPMSDIKYMKAISKMGENEK